MNIHYYVRRADFDNAMWMSHPDVYTMVARNVRNHIHSVSRGLEGPSVRTRDRRVMCVIPAKHRHRFGWINIATQSIVMFTKDQMTGVTLDQYRMVDHVFCVYTTYTPSVVRLLEELEPREPMNVYVLARKTAEKLLVVYPGSNVYKVYTTIGDDIDRGLDGFFGVA